MPKLHQLIATTKDRKGQSHTRFTELYKLIQEPAKYNGLIKTYRPLDAENGEKFSGEEKTVQTTVESALMQAREALIPLYNLIATVDATNCSAVADVVVDGKVLLPKMPSTHLMWLEKRLLDVRTFIEKLPTLDPSVVWHHDDTTNLQATAPVEQHKQHKVTEPMVIVPATEHHPAQVAQVSKDVIQGYWMTTRFSGAISAREQAEMHNRVTALLHAVKQAREQANSVEVASKAIGEPIFDYVFDGILG